MNWLPEKLKIPSRHLNSRLERVRKPLLVCFVWLLAFGSKTFAQENLSNDEFAPLGIRADRSDAGRPGPVRPYGVDNQTKRVFAPVYGNDSVEVLDQARSKRIQSLQSGFIKPQMVLYIPGMNRFVVSNEGDGSCEIFDADTYKLIDTVKFRDDADQLRYDPKTKRVYVGYYYDNEAVDMFDAIINKRIERDFELGAHP